MTFEFLSVKYKTQSYDYINKNFFLFNIPKLFSE